MPEHAPVQVVGYVKADDLATYLSVSRAHVYKLLDRGLPSLKIGRSRRFHLPAVDAWLADHEGAGDAA